MKLRSKQGATVTSQLFYSGKHGFVMPFVLTFFCLSQLVYMGLLNYQQISLQRLTEYQRYYETKIQERILKENYLKDEHLWTQDIERQVLEICDQQFSKHLIPEEMTVIIDHPQWRLSQFHAPNDGYLLERIDLYMEDDLPAKISTQLPFEISGKLENGLAIDDQQPLSWQSDYDKYYQLFSHTFTNHKILPSRKYQWHIKESIPDIPILTFLNGQSYLQLGKQPYTFQIVSRLRSGFSTQNTYTLRSFKALCHWQGTIFTSEMVDLDMTENRNRHLNARHDNEITTETK